MFELPGIYTESNYEFKEKGRNQMQYVKSAKGRKFLLDY